VTLTEQHFIMDKGETMESGSGVESKVTINRIENEDGSSIETRVEEVTGGYIKTVSKRFKDAEGNWQYKDDKSVSTDNPLEKKSLIEKLESVLNKNE